MKCIGILWNSMNEYRNEAIEDIKQYGTIEEMIPIDLGSNYKSFIKELYPFDGRHEGLDEYKASIMIDQYESNEICILFLDIKDSEKIYIERKRIYLYKNIEELKQMIRSKYKEKIDNYQFDNIYHMTDDETEYLFTLKVLQKYLHELTIKNVKIKRLCDEGKMK